MTDRICICMASLNACDIIEGRCVNLRFSPLFECLDTSKRSENTRFLEQRSDDWFALRNSVKITGSTIYPAIGCDGLSRQKDHFDKVVCGVKEKEPCATVKQAMQHGIDNEQNAVATIVGKIIPVLFPELKFFEEGCVVIKQGDGFPFMVISPDGILRSEVSLDSTKVAVEIKCPISKCHTHFPPRYLLQCLCEIEALDVECLLYTSWTRDETTLFLVHRDKELFDEAVNIAERLYGSDSPKKPTKLSDDQKLLKEKIAKKSKEIEFVGRFSSQVSGLVENFYHEVKTGINDLKSVLVDLKKLTQRNYELKRERATEAMVFLVADLDRSWEKDQIRCAPVCWFPKGYSLSTENLREIVEEVQSQCHREGIHIPCQSFDGQWHGLVTRDKEGKPLTVYQLQKDIWREVERKRKNDIVSEFKGMNKNVTCIIKTENRVDGSNKSKRKIIELTNGNIRLPIYKWTQRKNTETETVDQESTHTDTVTPCSTLADRMLNYLSL